MVSLSERTLFTNDVTMTSNIKIELSNPTDSLSIGIMEVGPLEAEIFEILLLEDHVTICDSLSYNRSHGYEM